MYLLPSPLIVPVDRLVMLILLIFKLGQVRVRRGACVVPPGSKRKFEMERTNLGARANGWRFAFGSEPVDTRNFQRRPLLPFAEEKGQLPR